MNRIARNQGDSGAGDPDNSRALHFEAVVWETGGIKMLANVPRKLFMYEGPDGCTLVYRNIIRPEAWGRRDARNRCEEIWPVFQPLADRYFLERLPFEFHQQWFDMYLGASS